MTFRKPSGGFTLIETMIVVVIVGVLTLVAYPAYQRFQVKADRAAAQSYLMHLAQRQQLYFNDSRSYAADEVVLGSPVPKRRSEDDRAEVGDNYGVAFDLTTTSPVPVFIIEATPLAGTRQEKENDGELSIDNTGIKLRTRTVNGVVVEEAW